MTIGARLAIQTRIQVLKALSRVVTIHHIAPIAHLPILLIPAVMITVLIHLPHIPPIPLLRILLIQPPVAQHITRFIIPAPVIATSPGSDIVANFCGRPRNRAAILLVEYTSRSEKIFFKNSGYLGTDFL